MTYMAAEIKADHPTHLFWGKMKDSESVQQTQIEDRPERHEFTPVCTSFIPWAFTLVIMVQSKAVNPLLLAPSSGHHGHTG